MSVLVAILAVVLALPVLLLVSIALGPAILVILFIFVCALPALWVYAVLSRHRA
jgi:hypothetical protein